MNPFAERSVTAKPRPEPETRAAREPQERPDARPRLTRTTPQSESAPQAKPAPRGAEKTCRERSQPGASGGAAKRPSEPAAASPDGMLFSALLDIAPTAPAFCVEGVVPQAQVQPRQSQAAEHGAPGAAPLALWQPLEAELGRITDRQPDGPVAMTLLLPRLGSVDARLQPLPAGGWDIALRFSPAAFSALEAHQERCRQALRRRMASRVRLRFEQRGAA